MKTLSGWGVMLAAVVMLSCPAATLAQEALPQVEPRGAEKWWSEQLFGLDQDKRFVLLIVTIGCTTGIILGGLAIVVGAVQSIQKRRAEMSLKREMIDRGLSADEITKIIQSTAPLDEVAKP